MNSINAWDSFVRTGLVCDYLQYVAESRGTTTANNNLYPPHDYEKGTKMPCSVLRTES